MEYGCFTSFLCGGISSTWGGGEHINADDVMTFCLYLMNTIRRSSASFSWFNRFYRFLLLLDG